MGSKCVDCVYNSSSVLGIAYNMCQLISDWADSPCYTSVERSEVGVCKPEGLFFKAGLQGDGSE